jgi:hypothetical protein
MSTLLCPNCNCPTVSTLNPLSVTDPVTYYRCTTCAHVWNTPKAVPEAEPTTVMTGRDVEKC